MTGLAAEVWYPIAAMRRAHVPVIVRTGRAAEIVAVVRQKAETKSWWWFQVGEWLGSGHGWSKREVALCAFGVQAERPWVPQCWRPCAGTAWPEPLPDPLPHFPRARAAGQVSKPPPPLEDLDPHRAHDGWPYPDLRLGCRVPPATLMECEARVLRAFRTQFSNSVAGLDTGTRSLAADMPAEMIKTALRYAEAERRALGLADAELPAVRSAWTPARRDLTDWDYALGWLGGADRRAVKAVAMRAEDPAFSFRQIAETLRFSSHKAARAAYDGALAHAFESAHGRFRLRRALRGGAQSSRLCLSNTQAGVGPPLRAARSPSARAAGRPHGEEPA